MSPPAGIECSVWDVDRLAEWTGVKRRLTKTDSQARLISGFGKHLTPVALHLLVACSAAR